MRKHCPVCQKTYDTKYNTLQECHDWGDKEALEQHITGICSAHCWNTVFNISDQVARGKTITRR